MDPERADQGPGGTAEPVPDEPAPDTFPGAEPADEPAGPSQPPAEDPVMAAVGIGSLLGSGLAILLALPAPREGRTDEGDQEHLSAGEPRFLDPEDLGEGIGEEPVDHPGARGALLLGDQAVREGKLQAAAAWFEAAHSLDPSLEIAYLLKALVLEEAGHLDRALRAAEDAVYLVPDDAASCYLLARLSARKGRRERARAILAELRAELPGLPGFVLEDEGFHELHDDPRYLAQIGSLDVDEDRERV